MLHQKSPDKLNPLSCELGAQPDYNALCWFELKTRALFNGVKDICKFYQIFQSSQDGRGIISTPSHNSRIRPLYLIITHSYPWINSKHKKY
eukprot:10829229-Karenia_brevis.AAC.1